MTTYQTLAKHTGTRVPAHLDEQATPPVVTRGARQGDVYVTATQAPAPRDARPVEIATGYKVVEGDADRNSHILIGDGTFTPGAVTERLVDYATINVVLSVIGIGTTIVYLMAVRQLSQRHMAATREA